MDHPNIHFVDFDNHVIITIPAIHSAEAGRYELTISNDSGEANTAFWLNVTGLPSAPQGPLQISDVNKTSATLSWSPPTVRFFEKLIVFFKWHLVITTQTLNFLCFYWQLSAV